MSAYHLYFLSDGQVIGSRSIEAADDDTAVRFAKDNGEGHVTEIWNAHSRIRVVALAEAKP